MLDKSAFLNDLAYLLEVEPSELGDDFRLHSGNFDSVSVVGTIALIDEHFGVTIDSRALTGCGSVGELVGFIEGKTTA